MNYKMMGRFIAQTLFVEMLFMIPAMLISIFCAETAATMGFLYAIGLIVLVQAVLWLLCRTAPSG